MAPHLAHPLRAIAALTSLLALGGALGCIDTSGLVFDREGPGGAAGAAGYQSAVLEDAPIAYWPLDELDGATSTPDISGNDFDAFLDDDMGAGEHHFDVPGALSQGTAAQLDLGASLFVSVPHPLAFGDSSYTLEAWVRIDSGDTGNLWGAVDQNSGGAGYSSYLGPDGINHKRYDNAGGNETVSQLGVAFADFRHVAITFDAADGATQIYVDGQATLLPPRTLALTWSAPGAPFSLGTADNAGGLTLDEVAVYDRVVAPERIAHHFDCADGC